MSLVRFGDPLRRSPVQRAGVKVCLFQIPPYSLPTGCTSWANVSTAIYDAVACHFRVSAEAGHLFPLEG